jgi:ion channel-forming bestrophin family protein
MNPMKDTFWRQVVAVKSSITPRVMPSVLIFGLITAGVDALSVYLEKLYQIQLGLELLPYELIGGVMGLLLMLRTNAGYERWWEARKLWGGIVNQSRNLVITALSYGPENREWQQKFVRWVAVFPYVACLSLRGEKPSAKIVALVGQDGADHLAAAHHMPSAVAITLAGLLREATDTYGMDRFAFLQADRERAMLIDHLGACERIRKTPLPLVYTIKIRQFIGFFLMALPFALLQRLDSLWLQPFLVMFVAYPLLSIDQISSELENPFDKARINHLPLDEISETIERDVLALLRSKTASA